MAIAAYLIQLWRQESQELGLDVNYRQSFFDIGCGNGLLVYLLTSEGYPGKGDPLSVWSLSLLEILWHSFVFIQECHINWILMSGIDIRARKIWSLYPPEIQLEVSHFYLSTLLNEMIWLTWISILFLFLLMSGVDVEAIGDDCLHGIRLVAGQSFGWADAVAPSYGPSEFDRKRQPPTGHPILGPPLLPFLILG